MLFEQELRKMARSTYWQNLYNASQDLSNVSLFFNTTNLSGLQVLFIYWLKVYHSVYENIQNMDFDFLDAQIIKDDVRVDAFIYWRSKYYESERQRYNDEVKGQKLNKNTKSGKKTYCNLDLRSE